MNIAEVFQGLEIYLPRILEVPKLIIFVCSILLSTIVGRYTPGLVWLIVHRLAQDSVAILYDRLVQPIRGSFQTAGTLTLISLSLVWLQADYLSLYAFLKPFVDLGVIVSVAWLSSRIFRQVLRFYGIELLRRLGREVNELLLVIETLVNVLIGFIAVLAFAQSQNFNLIGLMASLGLGGLAIAFAAQKILEQLLSTIVLYLDRPFVPGDYIRVSLNPHKLDVYGRVESIGLRSTKLRTSGKSTLVIIPNNTLANLDIENVTRGKKVMVMLYLDFLAPLKVQDAALVQQVITESTESLLGIDPGSTSISLLTEEGQGNGQGNVQGNVQGNGQAPAPPILPRRARVTFFILGSSEDSIQLRKRLLELASSKIAKRLNVHGIEFTMQEPTIYVESPVTL